MYTIGFIVDGLLPSFNNCISRRNPIGILKGMSSESSIAVMRFRWIASFVNNQYGAQVRYELFRSWRKYDVVIFLKSMGEDCIGLAKKLKKNGVVTIFDANVDYFTAASGTFFYHGMAPTEQQQEAAKRMAGICDAVIADSRHIAKNVSEYNQRVVCITDNVPTQMIGISNDQKQIDSNGKITLVWCGQAVKLFELLAIKNSLLEMSKTIQLKIITNKLSAIKKWYTPYQHDFSQLLKQLSHEIIPFHSVESLLSVFDQGGVFIAPRFLNNSYNMGHTEWKIALPMARGRIVLCSPLLSYQDVANHSNDLGIRLCRNKEDWDETFCELSSSAFNWKKEQNGATEVIRRSYSTEKVGNDHFQFVMSMLQP